MSKKYILCKKDKQLWWDGKWHETGFKKVGSKRLPIIWITGSDTLQRAMDNPENVQVDEEYYNWFVSNSDKRYLQEKFDRIKKDNVFEYLYKNGYIKDIIRQFMWDKYIPDRHE